MPRNLLIDTDPGIDDALAIFLALASPEVEVVGLTTVFGNAHVEVTTRNALRLLEIAGRTDIPVAAGAAKPMASSYHGPVPHIHGEDGLGNTDQPPPTTGPSDKTAVDLLIDSSHGHEPLTVLALGPLTNLAQALKKDPGLAERVHEVVVMGGNALEPGNVTPAAEANIWNDAEAADLVFGAFPTLAMVGLDVTHQVSMSGAQIAALAASPRDTARQLAAILRLYLSFFRETVGFDGIYLHDPAAVAYLIDSSLFTTERWPIRVELCGLGRGRTWPATGSTDMPTTGPWDGRPPVSVCTEVESEKVVDLIFGRLVG
ncbi:MAG: nucleoside hydrolase [bacterium]|nr:nucleoside hydrolase [bacterium]